MSRTYTTAAETAKAIRGELKAKFAAYGARFFSVTCSNYSGGSSVSIAWTDGPTPAQVKAITDKHEEVSRDAATGEILSGGNRFIFARREYSARIDAFALAECLRVYGTDPSADQWRKHRELTAVRARVEVRPDGQILAWSQDAVWKFEARQREATTRSNVVPFRKGAAL